MFGANLSLVPTGKVMLQPPVLDTCLLIREEVLPVYKDHLELEREAAETRYHEQLAEDKNYQHLQRTQSGLFVWTGWSSSHLDMRRAIANRKWEAQDATYAKELRRVVNAIYERPLQTTEGEDSRSE